MSSQSIPQSNEEIEIFLNNKFYTKVAVPDVLPQHINASLFYYGSGSWHEHFVGTYLQTTKKVDGEEYMDKTIIASNPVFKLRVYYKKQLIEVLYLRLDKEYNNNVTDLGSNPVDGQVITSYSLRTIHRCPINGNWRHCPIELSGITISTNKIALIRAGATLDKVIPNKDYNYYIYNIDHYHKLFFNAVRTEDIKAVQYFLNNVASTLQDEERKQFIFEMLHYTGDATPGLWHLAYQSAKFKDLSWFQCGLEAAGNKIDTGIEYDNYFHFYDYLSTLPNGKLVEDYIGFV